jgi:Ca2+-binding EF-hand superfamily protein
MKFPAAKTLSIAIATVLFGTAIAEQKAHDEMSGPDSKGAVEAEMKIMDTDKDGQISATEHAAGCQQMFQGMDANQDNRVTAAEMDAAQPPIKSQDASHGQEKGHTHEMSSTEKIKVIDTDGDGVLTAQEHAVGSKKMFKKMDLDKDGKLTATEIKTGHQKMMTATDQ